MTIIAAAYKLLASLLLLIGGGEVLIESQESKSAHGGPVFNKISFIQKGEKDIWLMKQSFYGVQTKRWDQLKIVVDKSTTPNSVSFHQIENGKDRDYKVSCYNCHASGPRAIRPKNDSLQAPLKLKDKIQVLAFNSLIKSYGPLKLVDPVKFKRKKPFKVAISELDRILKLESCAKCHDGSNTRNSLTAHQVHSIVYLVKTKQMPPWPHEMSEEDKKELQKFL